jgi:hypothetical protein
MLPGERSLTETDETRGEQQRRKAGRHREQDKSNQTGTHADGKRKRAGSLIGVVANQRLHDRSGQLECKRDQSDLAKIQRKGALQNRVDRG